MISVRAAVAADAVAIGAVHVAAWRSTYPGILPDAYLARMSVTRQAAMYERSIVRGVSVFIAQSEEAGATRARVVGFATGSRRAQTLGDGEIETLYVLDDYRELGVGRALLAAVAHDLADRGCASAFCWVLRDNPSRWFYQRLGGKEAAAATVRVAGVAIAQVAFTWSPIDRLFAHARAE